MAAAGRQDSRTGGVSEEDERISPPIVDDYLSTAISKQNLSLRNLTCWSSSSSEQEWFDAVDDLSKADTQIRQCNIQETTTSLEVKASNVHIGDTNVVYNIAIQPTENEQDSNSQVQETCMKLMSDLKEKVKSIASGESSLSEFSQRPTTPVNLSLVGKPQQIDDEFRACGHSHRREDITKFYERPSSDIVAGEMFARAKQTATDEAESKFRPDQVTAQEEYIEQHGNTVGVVGQAGIGKTTSSKKWALRALNGRMFGHVSFFFYIVVRFISFETKMTFLEFLLHTMLPMWNCNALMANAILEAMSSDPNVLMIFDGLDEAAFHSFSTEAPAPLLNSKNKPEVYLKNLAGGRLLPRSRKLFTSRPAPFYKLHPSHRPRFIVQILGLTPSSQRELGQQMCGNSYRAIHEKLERNGGLFAYCYVPVNFMLTVHYLLSFDSKDIQFVSLSRVLAFTCVQYSKTEHFKGQECLLNNLAKLAWDGFQRKKVVFGLEDFREAGIKDTTADAFLNTSVVKNESLKLKILEGHKLRYFSHLIWQEFFAAVHLMMAMDLEDFKKQHKCLSEDRYEVVAKFAFGICDRAVFDHLKAVVCGSSRFWNAKKGLLERFASSCMEERTKYAILQCCSWAHEAKNDEVASSVASTLEDQIDLSGLSLLLADVENLSYVIQSRSKPLTKLDISFNPIGDHGAAAIGKCVHNIKQLDLESTDLTSAGVGRLSEKIKDLSTPLKKLNLATNKVGDSGASQVAVCISNVQEVDLSEWGLTHLGAAQLFAKIQELEKPMKVLNLSRNDLSDEAAESLAACVQNVENLRANHCGFTESAKDFVRSKSGGNVMFRW